MWMKSSIRKRILSLVIVLMTCVALLPMTVQASEPFPTKLEAPTNVMVSQAPEDHGAYIIVAFNKSPELSAMIDEASATAAGPMWLSLEHLPGAMHHHGLQQSLKKPTNWALFLIL